MNRISPNFLGGRCLTARALRPNFPSAVASVTQTLGGVTEQRQRWSGVVRRGAVDTTPVFFQSSATYHQEKHPRDHA